MCCTPETHNIVKSTIFQENFLKNYVILSTILQEIINYNSIKFI